MPFLTIFTAPKAFSDPHIATIQCNAIQSWLHLGPEVEVILVGQETGMEQAANELGTTHLPDVARNPEGTPLVSSIFSLARAAAQGPFLAYLNADILVLPNFVDAARKAAGQADRFLLIGRRWDLGVNQPLDFSHGWGERLEADVQRRGRLHPPAGSDYFVFPKDLFVEMPDFAIGRAGWDNWMIYHARRQGWPVIDATPSLQVIHQNHDYSHLPGGKPHYDLEESAHNMAMAGGQGHMFTVLDSNRELRGGKVSSPRPSLLRMARRAELWLVSEGRQRSGPRWALARKLRHWRRARTGSRN
jgi:hypothetical protein